MSFDQTIFAASQQVSFDSRLQLTSTGRTPYRSNSRADSMKILVIGSGGREHAMVWKLKQSPAVDKIWCAPGNGGIAQDAECLPLDLNDVSAAADLAARLGADLTVVGPELPLVLGIGDTFANRGLALLRFAIPPRPQTERWIVRAGRSSSRLMAFVPERVFWSRRHAKKQAIL
jgi:hypothetical protein